MSENKLEKATFIRLYERAFDVCSLNRDKPGSLPGMARESSSVFARFGAHYCAETMVLLVERKATNSAYWKLDWLPKKTLETVGGLSISDAVDTIFTKARAWKDDVTNIVEANAPNFEVVMTPPPEDETVKEADEAMTAKEVVTEALEKVAEQVNAGAMGPNVTATVSVNGRAKRGRK